jgi:pimeloyl-ACP methyl ester carboxylesterase
MPFVLPLRPYLFICAALLLSGCAGVTVSSVSPAAYLAERRGDVLTTGALSPSAQEVLRVIGSNADECQSQNTQCRRLLTESTGLTDEQRLSALAEVWLQSALALERPRAASPVVTNQGDTPASTNPVPYQDASPDARLTAWMEAARHAYAYLFFTGRVPGERAFDFRQTQVRDYYNFAVQKVVEHLFKTLSSKSAPAPTSVISLAGWQITSQTEDLRLPQNAPLPEELIAASSLRFSGLRNTYRRDGLGAELVAVSPPPTLPEPPAEAPAFSESRYPVITALLRFDGQTLAQVLSTQKVQLVLFDPYSTAQMKLRLPGQTADSLVPLSANFTAGYGLWLARSGFAVQSLRTLFGMADGITRPHIQLMQPYDANRRTIIMLHGLASSPEAWINVANEVLGDDELRQRYQIWQVYYPTNAPLALNLHAIRTALQETQAHFDPAGTALASRDVTLIGHSMGGVLARLLVSSSGEKLWEMLPPDHRVSPRDNSEKAEQMRALRDSASPYLSFTPLPGARSAIFIAAPHRGTAFAENGFARRIANLVTLPLSMLEELSDLTRLMTLLPPGAPGSPGMQPLRVPNSIDNLSDRDPFVQAAAALPIAPQVRYHSIIGNNDGEVPLQKSSDGIVPYTSSHLDGAASERVIASSHSVQEHPQAILEIRRILREDLGRRPVGP